MIGAVATGSRHRGLLYATLLTCRALHAMASTNQRPYKLTPLKLGAEVHGINLSGDISEPTIQQIRDDVTEHRILVFRDQGILEPQRHLEISRWFGELESTFYDHPRSPDRDIFRVSNDRAEGCTGVGRTGWHIDGSFQSAPFTHSLYHIISVPKQGDTVFAPLTDLIEGLTPEKRARWERLWMVSDRRGGITHPLIYAHPQTGKPVLCFHLGMTEGYLWDHGTEQERYATSREFDEIQEDIYQEFVKDNGAIQYSHKWVAGDFIISDNLALGHEASTQTQLPRSQVGLRIMHRTTIGGRIPPAKSYTKPAAKQEL